MSVRTNRVVAAVARAGAALVVAGLVAGCGSSQFNVPKPPPTVWAVLDDARPPEARPLEPKVDLVKLDEDVATASPAAMAPDGRIAILPVNRAGTNGRDAAVREATGLLGNLIGADAPKPPAKAAGPSLPPDATLLLEGMVRAGLSRTNESRDPVGSLIEDGLMLGLLRAGVTRFLGPEELGAIGARKVATRDGQVTWQGSLDQLARVEPVTDAELLVAVRLDRAEASEVRAEVRWEHDPKELTAYRAAHKKYADTLSRRETDARAASVAYAGKCDDERRRYTADGGAFTEGRGGPPTSGDQGLQACAGTVAKLDAAAEGAARQRTSAPHPDELARAAAKQREERALGVFAIEAQVRLIGGKDLRLLWFGDLHARGATPREAADLITARIVQEVGRLRQAGSAFAPPAPVPAKR